MPELLAAALAAYFVIISIVAVAVTVWDKNIAIANGKLEEAAAKSPSKGKKASKNGGSKNNSKSAKSSQGRNKAKPKRRVPEKTLLIIAALGGSVAMLVTMRVIRHKTQHMKFMVGIPVIIVLQCLLAVVLAVFLSRNDMPTLPFLD